MASLLVGVIGHVDHGKTALVRALTGVETDRLKEEAARGISIVPGFALLRARGGSAEIDLVDLPGHERFVRTMISGATGMRAVLLAVDANEGIKPQTVEHLEIAGLIGVRRGVIALTKCDLVDAATIARRTAELRAATARVGIMDARVVATSVVAGTGLETLAEALTGLVDDAAPPLDDGFPYLPIDRVFARPGFGAVVTGTLRRGRLAVGDRVAIGPGGKAATVRSLQRHGRSVQDAEPGLRTAVALRGVDLSELATGQALCAVEQLVASRWIDVALTVVGSAGTDLASGTTCRLLFGTSDVPARLRLLDRDVVKAGETAMAQIHTEADIAVLAREPIVLRLDTPPTTIAGGRVLDPVSRRRKRHDARLLAELRDIANGTPRDALALRLARSGTSGDTLAGLAQAVGVGQERVRRTLSEIGAREIGNRFVGATVFARTRDAVLDTLARHHRDHPIEHGLSLDRIARATLCDEPIAAAAARDLVATRDAVQAGTLYRRADFDPTRNETEHVRLVEAVFRKARLSPPDETEAIGRDIRRRDALTYLVTAGTLIRALDRVQKRTILFHRDALTEAKGQLRRSFPKAVEPEMGFLAREAGAALGISRKYSIPLLEHFDAIRFTRRVGDTRIFAESRGDTTTHAPGEQDAVEGRLDRGPLRQTGQAPENDPA